MMSFEEKRDFALKELDASAIWKNDYRPPIFKFLWWLGIKIAPPHYRSFLSNLILFSALLGTVFGVLNTPASWIVNDFGPIGERGANILFGIFLALINSLYYSANASKNKLTAWNDIPSGKNPKAESAAVGF